MIASVRFREAAITLAGGLLSLLLRPWTRRSRQQRGAPGRILILRPCCLGDVLMTTPLLRALDEAYPAATIAYGVGRWSAAALANNPHLDRVLLLPDRPAARDWLRIAGRLRRERFDLAVLPDRSPLAGLAALLAGIPRRVGLDSAGRGFALTDPVAVRGTRHETDRALDLARALGIPGGSRRLIYQPGREAVGRVAHVLAERTAGEPLFLVHPGGGANPGVTMDGKRWPPERFAAVADALLARHGGSVALVGGSGDRAAVAATGAAMRGAALDLCGALDLDALGALCGRATLYFGNDAGTTHLAEARGSPTVAVFGPTDPAMYGPVDGIGEAVWNPTVCEPVVRRGDLTRGGGSDDRCIDSVTVEQVLAAAERVLARAAARRGGMVW